MIIGLGLGLGFQRTGSSAPPVAGSSPTTFTTITPSTHYHPTGATILNYSDVTAAVGERVKSFTDRQGLADIAGGSSTTAPLLAQDAPGRKNLNFRNGSWASIADTLTGLDGRNICVIAVVRVHNGGNYQIFYPRWNGVVGTQNTNRVGALALVAPVTDARHMYPCCGNVTTTSGAISDATNKKWMVPGSQLQVIAFRSSSSNVLYRTNGKLATSAGAPSLGTGRFGAILGGTPNATGATVDTASGMSLYELVVVNEAVSDANFGAAVDAVMTNWGITDYTEQYIYEGNSVTEGNNSHLPLGTNGVNTDENIAMLASAPGQPRADQRHVNVARGGSTIGTAPSDNGQNNSMYRRDLADSVYDQILPGGASKNRVYYQDGTNDWAAGTSGADCYTAYKNIIYTTTTGYLQRGWSVVAAVPIARASTGAAYTACVDQRALMVSSLVADCQAGSGQTFDGLVDLRRVDQITVSGSTIFLTDTNTLNTTYYQLDDDGTSSDRTHPSLVGTAAMLSGGDNAAQGYGA